MFSLQTMSFAILGVVMALFIWGKWRYDMVAVFGLLIAVLLGVVAKDQAFTGFSDDIVIIVGSALVVSAAVARSGVMEALIQKFAPNIQSVQMQLIVLVGIVTLLSAFVKNVGALAIMMPVAFQMARRSNTLPSVFLMPMAFGSLLGGMMTLVGTSPNIIVSRMRGEMIGQPFEMFDFFPVGFGLSLAGVLFLAFGYRLLPAERRAAASIDQALEIKDYMTEAEIPASSVIVGKTVSDLITLANSDVIVTSIMRNGTVEAKPFPDATLKEGDVLLLEGDPDSLERVVARAGLSLEGENRRMVRENDSDEIGSAEAVIGPNSMLTGQSAGQLALHQRFDINLLAVSRSGYRLKERLRDITLQAGDVVLLKGSMSLLPERMKELGCLPLAARELRLGNVRGPLIPLLILAGAMGLTAFGIWPVTHTFFAAACMMVLFGCLTLREAYDSIEWPILVMLGALIPVSESIRVHGGTELIASHLSAWSTALPSYGAVTLIMMAAMAVTPFLNNAATVLVMAPVAASFATQLGYKPDAFLMAVAVGAACDFLTPIGHQCNTLVMGPGGYKFGDYWRLGLPLSIIVILLGVPLIMLFWPL